MPLSNVLPSATDDDSADEGPSASMMGIWMAMYRSDTPQNSFATDVSSLSLAFEKTFRIFYLLSSFASDSPCDVRLC